MINLQIILSNHLRLLNNNHGKRALFMSHTQKNLQLLYNKDILTPKSHTIV